MAREPSIQGLASGYAVLRAIVEGQCSRREPEKCRAVVRGFSDRSYCKTCPAPRVVKSCWTIKIKHVGRMSVAYVQVLPPEALSDEPLGWFCGYPMRQNVSRPVA